ncbi:MAG: ferritin family protein [Elusimicrobia bacterium]|nr:ferritin family protein [Elusimicrobiota bacterium]
MNIFSINEIVNFAIEIEKNGEKFYRSAAAKAEDEKTKSLFTMLADEEVEHMKTFKNLLGKVEKYESPASFNDEYYMYLKAYVDGKIFSNLPQIKSTADALQYAINAESDSILYYFEMKNFVLEDEKKVINSIIEEERRHFVKLTQLAKKYKGV